MINMPRIYYNYLETYKSSKLLNKIANKVDFVLIGGWAVNSYVNIQASKDIDIAINPDKLEFFREYGIQDYNINIKYSVIDDVTVDLFVNGISDKELTLPINEIFKNNVIKGNIKVVDKNMLVLLKLCGYFRDDIIKINKDIIDVVSLLFYADINLEYVKKYVDKYKIDERKGSMGMLEYLEKGERLWDFVCETKEEYTNLKNKSKKKIKNIFYRA